MAMHNYFKTKARLLALSSPLLIAVATSCSTVTNNMVAMQFTQSKYTPVYTSEKAVDDWANIIRPVSGRVVSDELGTYFHKVNGEDIERVFLNKEDEGAVRNLLAGDIGLLEPLYTFNVDGTPYPDWAATSRRHEFLTKNVRLTLLPLEASKKYHQLITELAKLEAKRKPAGFGAASAAMSGDFGLYNLNYEADVLKKIGSNFQYVIKDLVAAQYYSHAVDLSYGTKPPSPTVSEYRWLSNSINAYPGLNIVPRSFFSSKVKGNIRYDSGCSVLNLTMIKEQIKDQKEISDVPYFSAISSTMKDKSASTSELQDAQTMFKRALSLLDKKRVNAEKACIEGLGALQVSGSIQSQKLK